MIDQRRSGIHAQRDHLSLDRPHRRPQLGWKPADAARPGAGREHDRVGCNLAAILQNDAIGASAGDRDLLDRRVLAHDRARALGRLAQGRRELPILDLMILRAPHRARELAGEMRLAPAGLRGADPIERQAKLVLEHEMMLQARLIVGGERHDDGALRAQLNVNPGRLRKLRREGRPARLALAPERHQRLLARLRLAAGGEHAGGSV